jgi:hypothetical protein
MRALQLNQLRNYRLLNWGLLLNRLAVGGFMGFLLAYALWPWVFPPAQPTRTVIVYGFSILGEVMNEGIFPAFAARWEVETGEQVELISAFASLGHRDQPDAPGCARRGGHPLPGAGCAAARGGWYRSRAYLARPAPRRGGQPYPLYHPGPPREPGGDIQDLSRIWRAPASAWSIPIRLTSGGAQWALFAEYHSVSE